MVEESAGLPALPKISFGVKNREKSKVVASAKVVVDVEVDSDEERQKEEAEHQAKRRKLTHFDEGSLMGDHDKVKEAVVIPMVVEHDWRTQKLLEKEKEGTLTEEEKAKLSLLIQPSVSEEDSEINRDTAIVVNNSIENTEDADYSAIPIESFGLAILRGCNWKDGDGIGKNPQKVPLRLPTRRPPGLGLGATPKADPTNVKNDAKNGNGKEQIGDIKAGSCIKIIDGRSKGLYGKVEGRDDDTSSLFVRLAIGSKTVKVSQFAVVAITTKEYEQDAKCLNKVDYDREKDKIEKQRIKNESEDFRKPSTSKVESIPSRNEKEKKYEEKSKETLWARTDLLVRFIDDEYKRGKLYKQKVRIVDVAGLKDITIEDDRRDTYYNVRQSWLETVIPRKIGEKLMIVGGEHRGKLAMMIDKDKTKEKVTAKLIANNEIVKVYFENVCAVNVQHEEDYE